MAIWEPCNYVSNLAYDRLVVEICKQEDWTLGEYDVRRIAEAFSLVTFGSSFMHGSGETILGQLQDTTSNNLFAYILHQVLRERRKLKLNLKIGVLIIFLGIYVKYSL